MTFFRKDLITGEEVSICPDRMKRPMDNQNKQIESQSSEQSNIIKNCPFCPGNEFMIKEVISKANSNVKTVYNKYPIFEEDGELYGLHYVVIEGKEHFGSPFLLSLEERIEIISEYINVAKTLYDNDRISYVQIFKNYKRQGGASLEHPHSQIAGISALPEKVTREINNLKNYLFKNNSCYYCDTIKEEIKNDKRVIYNDGTYIAVCPYVSIYPYEIRIYKINHESSIINLSFNEIKDLSIALNNVMKIIYKKLGDIPHNMFFKFIKEEEKYYHFYIEICPRIGNFGGLETSAGIGVLTISPETAAHSLKSCQP